MRNFLSIGNVEQVVDLDKDPLTLVLGENLDSGANSSRNGAGKSAILNAISYALYGAALTQIKRDNLINKANGKNMHVVVEFEKNGEQHRIERGRRPNYLKWLVNNKQVTSPDTDEAEGDSRWTQKEIERCIGISPVLFKHILAMNTYTEPFLSLPVGNQRAIIEELLGITLLSQKADKLKEKIRDTKEKVKEEEIRIQVTRESNSRTEREIEKLEGKSSRWSKHNIEKLEDATESLKKLEHLDVDVEIENHKTIAQLSELSKEIENLEKSKKQYERSLKTSKSREEAAKNDLILLEENKCPMCKQSVKDHNHEDLKQGLEQKIQVLTKEIEDYQQEISGIEEKLIPLMTSVAEYGDIPETFYNNIEEAYNHRSTVESLTREVEQLSNEKNPYDEQIESLRENNIQEIDYTVINELTRLKEHQDYLLKFLTSKDSFIRKRIIDQNLNYLNHRLSYYLQHLQLPHSVKFLNDLSVEITELGLEFDFDNLSRGERTRLILSLSWSFRDVFESMNAPINLLFIDELIDNGLDQAGVESALEVLKRISRERNKNVFLISHREELMNRVTQILTVVKENGFTMLQQG